MTTPTTNEPAAFRGEDQVPDDALAPPAPADPPALTVEGIIHDANRAVSEFPQLVRHALELEHRCKALQEHLASARDLASDVEVVTFDGQVGIVGLDELQEHLAAASPRVEPPPPPARADPNETATTDPFRGVPHRVAARLTALLEAHRDLVLLCEPPGCSPAEFDAASAKRDAAVKGLLPFLHPPAAHLDLLAEVWFRFAIHSDHPPGQTSALRARMTEREALEKVAAALVAAGRLVPVTIGAPGWFRSAAPAASPTGDPPRGLPTPREAGYREALRMIAGGFVFASEAPAFADRALRNVEALAAEVAAPAPSAEPPKIVRDLSTPERREFWARSEESAREVETWPDWKRAGINVATERAATETREREGCPHRSRTPIGGQRDRCLDCGATIPAASSDGPRPPTRAEQMAREGLRGLQMDAPLPPPLGTPSLREQLAAAAAPGSDARGFPDGTLVVCELCPTPHPKGDDGRPCRFPKVAGPAPSTAHRIAWQCSGPAPSRRTRSSGSCQRRRTPRPQPPPRHSRMAIRIRRSRGRSRTQAASPTTNHVKLEEVRERDRARLFMSVLLLREGPRHTRTPMVERRPQEVIPAQVPPHPGSVHDCSRHRRGGPPEDAAHRQ